MSEKKTGGIILATGCDSQGRRIDPLTELGKTTIVKRIVQTYQLASISPIIVITGYDGLSVERHLAIWGVMFFRMDEDAKNGDASGLRSALGYICEKCSQVVVTPVEYPMFYTQTIRELSAAKGEVRAPFVDQTLGWPMLMETSALPRLMEQGGQDSLEGFFHRCRTFAQKIEFADEGCICNMIDREEDCTHLLKQHNEQMLHPYVRVDIDCPTKVMDPRIKMLLLQIRETGSLKTACSRISLSIGKAWEMINVLEEALEYPVVERRQGGKRGGSTKLTEEGLAYLEKYCLLEKKVQEYADREFWKIFGA